MPRQSSIKNTKPKATKPKSAQGSASKAEVGLGLSDLHLRYAGLEKEHQKVLKQIKSKQTDIDKLGEKMEEIARKVTAKSLPMMHQLQEIDAKIHELFQQILARPKLGKQSKQNIKKVYNSLQFQEIISPNFDDEDEDEDDYEFNDNEFEAEFRAYFNRQEPDFEDEDYGQNSRNQFREAIDGSDKIDREEQKKMRQLFLRLADIFHPDKCLEHDRAEEFAEIMKEVNQAYQTGNFAKLLAIEKQYEGGLEIDLNNENDLVRRCDRLEHEIHVLKNQFDRLKQDLKSAKATQQGQMTTEYVKLSKSGIDPIDVLTNEIQERLDLAAEVHQFVQDFYDKKITIKRFMEGPDSLSKESIDLDDFLEEIVFTIM
jgi:hypothetical protein